MKAKSINGKSTAEISMALSECMADGFKPSLAFVFLSVKQDIKAIANLLSQHSIQVFGATSGGEIADSEISQGGISILLLDMDNANFRILHDDYTGRDVAEVARAMTAQALTIFAKPGFFNLQQHRKTTGYRIGRKNNTIR